MSAKVKTLVRRNPLDLVREIQRQPADIAARLLEQWIDEAEERGRGERPAVSNGAGYATPRR